MKVERRRWAGILTHRIIILVSFAFVYSRFAEGAQSEQPTGSTQTGNSATLTASECDPARLGSPYIPVDKWVYSAVLRLYSLGYVDAVYLGMRPWTRTSIMHMMEEAGDLIEDSEEDGDPGVGEAREIYNAINRELHYDMEGPCGAHEGMARIESVYTIARAISGTPLRDSYHLGSTIIDDYGRPFENGFNNYSGVSGYGSTGRFALYVRAEFQGSPSAAGYSTALAQTLSCQVDGINYVSVPPPLAQPVTICPSYPEATIAKGPIATVTHASVLEAYLSYQLLNHVVSFGKRDEWMGPGLGASMAYSNNAENIYAFHINRIEPLHIPGLSRVTGPFRYEFLVGELHGHTLVPNPDYDPTNPNSLNAQPNVLAPGNPWVHVEKISFKPTKNFELGFERTAMFGGEGHEGVSLHSFLRSFFSLSAGAGAQKNGNTDPGARFGSFDFSYRLPFVRKWLTVYTDSEVHDDVSPIDAPRRASWRPGIYLSHVPGIPKLDVRVEAATTDPPSNGRTPGQLMYYEYIEKQGYTNQGQLFGDWIGREDKGGQGWITYHLSGNEWIQISARNQKAEKDFIPGSNAQIDPSTGIFAQPGTQGGMTLNDIGFQIVKRVHKDVEVNGNFTVEHWKAPIYLPGDQMVTSTNIQITWYPGQKMSF
jgi:hypothetical protein